MLTARQDPLLRGLPQDVCNDCLADGFVQSYWVGVFWCVFLFCWISRFAESNDRLICQWTVTQLCLKFSAVLLARLGVHTHPHTLVDVQVAGINCIAFLDTLAPWTPTKNYLRSS